jgi:choline dehydrogenase-like flavoprotein
VNARVIVLAASCCETARILLNSRSSSLFPNGVANSTGLVGKYIMDTVGSSVNGYLPILEDLPPTNEDGVGGMHLYMPWWLYQQQHAGKMNFARGYHIEIGGGRGMPGAGILGNSQALQGGGYGKDLKRDLRKIYGATVHFAGRGEMIPNEDSYCEIDPNAVDQWGIPVLRFHFKWSDNEINQVRHMHDTFKSIIETMGGTVAGNPPDPKTAGISTGGSIIHEAGTVQMGSDPKKSVLNKYCQSHEVKNLFVCDAAPFVSQPDKNVTLSIVAFAWRAADYLAGEMRKGNV